MSGLPRTCVIGAGSSGIAGLKGLLERDVPVQAYEASDRVGGNWVFGNRNGMSSAYRDLHINTSRERMEYSDYPMPKRFPDFPHHTHIASYFNDYVDHFGLREHIRFETSVHHAGRRPDGVWELELRPARGEGRTELYDALVVANGHHWDPRWPEPPFPGRFDGEELHAHHYVEADGWRDKRVVVLGMGNSAMDIAVEASYVADQVFLAARRGAWVLPKYVGGIPLDQVGMRGNRLERLMSNPRVPWRVQQRGLEMTFLKHIGEMEAYGLPRPDHRLGEAHPTVSGRILDRISHGRITPKANIAELQGDRIKFADGSVEEADVVVYCTGYKVSFPFFDQDFISAPDNDLPLFRRVFHPEIDNVFFLALLQPLGATMPLAEAQGRWVASYLRGEYHLPPPAELRTDVERERETMFKRYVASKRHTMQVDFDRYMHELEVELSKGAERARRAGYRLPVALRASALSLVEEAPALQDV
jgi:dimethylaniline monooxygenase (N-oxide forming)